jgi:hypothetical protein
MFSPQKKNRFNVLTHYLVMKIDPRVSLKVVICVVHDTMKGWSFHNLSSPIRGYNTTKAKVARVHRKVANILHFLPNQVGYWDCNGWNRKVELSWAELTHVLLRDGWAIMVWEKKSHYVILHAQKNPQSFFCFLGHS